MQFKDQGPSNTELFAVSPESLYSTDQASNVDLSNFFCLWEGMLEDFLMCNLSYQVIISWRRSSSSF